MRQTPIYIAKKIDSDEYIEGDLFHGKFIVTTKWSDNESVGTIDDSSFDSSSDSPRLCYHEIDPLTLAIHFPDILDSEGAKIFASLGNDRRGGTIVTLEVAYNCEYEYKIPESVYNHELKEVDIVVSMKSGCVVLDSDYIPDDNQMLWFWDNLKVVGVQKVNV